jgi:hypothetical protein
MHLLEFIEVGPTIYLFVQDLLGLLTVEEEYLVLLLEGDCHALYRDIIPRGYQSIMKKITKLSCQYIF